MNAAALGTPVRPEPTSHVVRSNDGTEIGYVKLGFGPPLVMVHGSLATKEGWLPVANRLAEHFTCILMDRRGRGSSGDFPGYSIAREYDDVEAVLSVAGPDAFLLGHSFGAVCSLGAALRVPLRKLVLYEPPMPTGGPIAGASLEVYRQSIERGDPDQALELGLRQFAGIPQAQIDLLRGTRLWPRLTALAAGWTREIEAIDALGTEMDQYATITAPTLLMAGSQTRQHPTYRHPIAALTKVLPDARITEFEGHGHLANMTAPETVAQRVHDFLLS